MKEDVPPSFGNPFRARVVGVLYVAVETGGERSADGEAEIHVCHCRISPGYLCMHGWD